jgi:tetratricopeptide (TPR) repeat protein
MAAGFGLRCGFVAAGFSLRLQSTKMAETIARRLAPKRISGGFALAVFLAATCAGFMGLKLATDKVLRKKVPGSSIIYVPSGKFLKYATFGYSALAADLVYLWAIQYYGSYEIVDRFTYLDHIFAIIAELDPRYTDPYEIGSMIAGQEARNVPLALKILDRGAEKNPDMWLFDFEAGHIAQMQLKDFDLARKYYGKAMAVPGAPDLIKRLYASTTFKAQDYQTAWETWTEVLNTATEDRVKEIASNHLYQVKAAMDLEGLTGALGKFREKYGRFPSALDKLVQMGILPSLPKDMDDKAYVYDPATGAVRAPSVWWKR